MSTGTCHDEGGHYIIGKDLVDIGEEIVALVLDNIRKLADNCTRCASLGCQLIQQGVELMDELIAKIKVKVEAEAKAYKEYFDCCNDTSKNAQFEITATSEMEELDATID